MSNEPSIREPANVPMEIARILAIDPNTAISIKIEAEGTFAHVTVKMHAYVGDDSDSYRPLIHHLEHYRLVPVSIEPFAPST